MNNKVLFTDGEGPIVFKDLAFNGMGRVRFPVAHWLTHGITDEDISEESREAQLF